MKRWIRRGGLLLLALAAGGFLLAASGIVPIKASAGHWAITEWFLQFSKQRSVATHTLTQDVPPLDEPALVLKGAGHYEFGCRSCHGAPGEPLPRIAQGMLPRPPDLVQRVPEMDTESLFYIVKHGIKLTGMPAWPAQERDDEVWAVVAFLRELPTLDRAAYRRLVGGEPEPTAPVQMLAPVATARTVPAAVLRTCARCHGDDGLGRDSEAFPKLAGQRREYLENSLRAYAEGSRHSGIMEPLAVGLDQRAIRELADYYASMPAAQATPGDETAASETFELGRTIATEGLPSRRIPACLECHDPSGRRAKPAYPSLAGQPAGYLELQLRLFQRGQRGGSAYAHLMQEIAPRLKPEEIRAVAEYLATLPGPSPASSR